MNIKAVDREELKELFFKDYGFRVWITHKNGKNFLPSEEELERYEDTNKASLYEMETFSPLALLQLMVVIDTGTSFKRIFLDEDLLPMFSYKYEDTSLFTNEEDIEAINALRTVIDIMSKERGYVFYRAKGSLD